MIVAVWEFQISNLNLFLVELKKVQKSCLKRLLKNRTMAPTFSI